KQLNIKDNPIEVIRAIEQGEVELADVDPDFHQEEYIDGLGGFYIVHQLDNGEEVDMFNPPTYIYFGEHDFVKEEREKFEQGEITREEFIDFLENLNDLDDQFDYSKVVAYQVDGKPMEFVGEEGEQGLKKEFEVGIVGSNEFGQKPYEISEMVSNFSKETIVYGYDEQNALDNYGEYLEEIGFDDENDISYSEGELEEGNCYFTNGYLPFDLDSIHMYEVDESYVDKVRKNHTQLKNDKEVNMEM